MPEVSLPLLKHGQSFFARETARRDQALAEEELWIAYETKVIEKILGKREGLSNSE